MGCVGNTRCGISHQRKSISEHWGTVRFIVQAQGEVIIMKHNENACRHWRSLVDKDMQHLNATDTFAPRFFQTTLKNHWDCSKQFLVRGMQTGTVSDHKRDSKDTSQLCEGVPVTHHHQRKRSHVTGPWQSGNNTRNCERALIEPKCIITNSTFSWKPLHQSSNKSVVFPSTEKNRSSNVSPAAPPAVILYSCQLSCEGEVFLSLPYSDRQLWQPLTWWAISFSQETVKEGGKRKSASFSSSNLYFNALLSWSVLNTKVIMIVHAVSCLSLSGFSARVRLRAGNS